MDVRWLTFRVSIDDVRLDRAACRRIRKNAVQRAVRQNPRFRLIRGILFVVGVTLGFLAGRMVGIGVNQLLPEDFTGLPRLLIALTATIPPVALALLLAAVVNRHMLQSHVHAAMCELGYDLCTSCGYWLRGHDDQAANCPECGAARDGSQEAKR